MGPEPALNRGIRGSFLPTPYSRTCPGTVNRGSPWRLKSFERGATAASGDALVTIGGRNGGEVRIGRLSAFSHELSPTRCILPHSNRAMPVRSRYNRQLLQNWDHFRKKSKCLTCAGREAVAIGKFATRIGRIGGSHRPSDPSRFHGFTVSVGNPSCRRTSPTMRSSTVSSQAEGSP